MSDLDVGLKQLADARAGYDRASRYYEGDIEEVLDQFHPAIRALINRIGMQYRFRIARKCVTALANRVKLTSVTVPDDDTSTATLEELREANDMTGVWESEQITRTLEYGDTYLFVWPVDEGDDDADPALQSAGVEMLYHSPLNVRMVYDGETKRYPRFVIKKWQDKTPLGQPIQRVDLYYRDRIERYSREGTNDLQDQVEVSQEMRDPNGLLQTNADQQGAAGWTSYDADGQESVLPNPYDELPWFHFRTAMPYGRPRHEDAYGPQDGINKLLITHLASVDAMGFPARVALVDPAAVLDQNNDDPDWDDDAQAANGAGAVKPSGQSSSLRTGPGILTTLTGMKDVKEFAAADSHNLTDPVELYIRLMALATNTPLYELDPATDPPSGRALKTANAPLDADQEHFEALIDGPFRNAYRFALKLRGIAVEKVDVGFAPPPKTADPEDWTVAGEMESRGVPQRQILHEIGGYDDEQLDEWLPTDEQTDLLHRLDVISRLASAIGGVGGFPAAIAAGIVDPGKAAAIVANLLTLGAGDQGTLKIEPPTPVVPPTAPGVPPSNDTAAASGEGGANTATDVPRGSAG